MKLDSHQHFWRYGAAEYPWIPAGSPLQRDWLPADLAPLLAAAGIDGCIAVQARQAITESKWLLELADASPIVRGVVGWVDLRSEAVGAQLAELARHPRFCGVRHVVQDEPDDEFVLGAAFQRGIAQLEQFGLSYDLLIYPRQLASAIALVRQFPRQRFVLDHIAKPLIKARVLSPWREQICELAAAPNVMCKISGLVTEADRAAWQAEDFRPYLDVVFEAFGEDRVMYGSDWPVCLLAASYSRQKEIVDRHLERYSMSACEKFFGANAAKAYALRASS